MSAPTLDFRDGTVVTVRDNDPGDEQPQSCPTCGNPLCSIFTAPPSEFVEQAAEIHAQAFRQSGGQS